MNWKHYDHKKIASTRKAQNLTQAEIAEKAGVSVMTIYRVEEGKHASYEVLNTIANLLDINLKDFLHDTKKNSLVA